MVYNLREQCKLLKALRGISYKRIAEQIGIRPDSFYCWLKGYYEFGYRREQQLIRIIKTFKE